MSEKHISVKMQINNISVSVCVDMYATDSEAYSDVENLISNVTIHYKLAVRLNFRQLHIPFRQQIVITPSIRY